MYESPAHSKWLVPFAALLAAAIILGSVAFALYRRTLETPKNEANLARVLESGNLALVPPISESDHILGPSNAPIVFIEYSDLECPFCKDFHKTMKSVYEEYGKDGNIAWVYRHFPLAQLHSKAPTEALASECVAQLSGNDGFWKFVEIVYTEGPGNDQLDLSLLPVFAERVGANRKDFERCMSEGSLMSIVETQFEQAKSAGGVGTPFTVVLVAGQQIPIEGAQPYVAMSAIARTLLNNIGERSNTLVPPSEAPLIKESPINGTLDIPASSER